ncbi:MAG: hypothetical protein AAF828_01145 [Bacteroidota bacterium]
MKSPLLLLFCLICCSLWGQTLTVSEEINLRSDTEYHLVGKAGGKVMLLQDRTTKHFVTAYDRRMQESWEKELELRGKNIRLIEVMENARGFQLLYLFRQGGKNYLQLDGYDPAANLRDSVTVAEFSYWLNNPAYELVRSQDRSKVVLLVGENPQKIDAIAMDLDSAKLLYRTTLEPEDFYFREDFLQAEVSNQGDAFVVIERDNFVSRRRDHIYEVHQLSTEEDRPKNFNVSLGDSLTYDVFFTYDNLNDRLVCGGLYAVKDLLRARGYFYSWVNPRAPAEMMTRFEPFSNQLVENVEGKKLRNRKNRGLDELSIRHGILRRDGGMILVTERNRQLERRAAATQTQVLSNYNGRPLVDYYYDEMVVFSIKPGGELQWHNILHKKQYSQDDGGSFSSFMLLESPRTLRFLFNDEIRFENTVSEYVLDGRGELDRNSLFNTRDLDLKLRFRDGVQVAANEVIIPSERRNRLRLVTMTY